MPFAVFAGTEANSRSLGARESEQLSTTPAASPFVVQDVANGKSSPVSPFINFGARITALAHGTKMRGKSILVATGVEYRRLDVPRLNEFEGAGVYAATDTETKHVSMRRSSS